MNKKLIKQASVSFKNKFKTEPLMVFSLGRINLIGNIQITMLILHFLLP